MVTREQWLDAGMAGFGEAGLDGLKVEAMARRLGSSKAGFYWYFKSRARFERDVIAHWREVETRQIIAAVEKARTPREKLSVLFDEVNAVRASGDFLFHLRRLGRRRKAVKRVVEEVEAERLGYLAAVLEELGKPRAEAEQVAEAVYHLYLGWYERHRFAPTAPKEAQRGRAAMSALTGVEIQPQSKRGGTP